MNTVGFRFLLLLIVIGMAIGCAKRGTPDGGPVDMEPPKFVRATPENFSTNFDAREIRIYFDEYVKVTDPQRQVIISPPMDPPPEITPLGTASRSIRIRIHDTLLPQTTYTVNFGRSISDNNEGNTLDFFTYAFSTGSYIDSLSISGSVSDALLKVPDPFISVLLYEADSTYSDSAVYLQTPRYVTNTLDSATTFQLNNLKEGTYRLVGLKDGNNNYRFDPETDKIAFSEEYITIPTETVFDLILFREELDQNFLRPELKARQHVLIGYEGRVNPDSLQISLLEAPENFQSRITKEAEKDTLHYWFSPQVERDTLLFQVSTPARRDTLLLRRKEMEPDSLEFRFQPSTVVNFKEPITILPNIPLVAIEDSLITITDTDSTRVQFTGSYDAWNNRYQISFEKEENQNYQLIAFPGAFKDFFGTQNDTIKKVFRTQAYADYGNVSLTLIGPEDYPVLVQLTDDKGRVQAEQQSSGTSSLQFQNIPPGTYFLRVIFDRNKNEKWDTGRFLEGRQPERIQYYPDTLKIRANWDWEITEPIIVE